MGIASQHRHPHAEPPSPPVEVDDETKASLLSEALAMRLDNLISFLEAHFGHVEMYVPGMEEENSKEKEIHNEEMEEGEEIRTPSWREQMEKTKFYEDDWQGKKGVKGMDFVRTLIQGDEYQQPVIRVRVDDQTADVSVVDLVSLLQSRICREVY
jgi:hypothetical protein